MFRCSGISKSICVGYTVCCSMSFLHLRKITLFQVHPVLLCLSSHANDVTSSYSVRVLVEIKQILLMNFKCMEK